MLGEDDQLKEREIEREGERGRENHSQACILLILSMLKYAGGGVMITYNNIRTT